MLLFQAIQQLILLQVYFCDVWGFHGGEDDDDDDLGYGIMYIHK
jgi:hypothetical protein